MEMATASPARAARCHTSNGDDDGVEEESRSVVRLDGSEGGHEDGRGIVRDRGGRTVLAPSGTGRDLGAIADCTKADNLNSQPYRTRQRKSNKLCCIIIQLLCGELWYSHESWLFNVGDVAQPDL
jgi:hypothetical protein